MEASEIRPDRDASSCAEPSVRRTRVLAVACCGAAWARLLELCAAQAWPENPSKDSPEPSSESKLCCGSSRPRYSLGYVSTIDGARRLLGSFDVCVLGRGEKVPRGEVLDERAETERFVREISQAGVPVIVLAEAERPQDDHALMEAGAVDYLVREHINLPLFERALRYAIERKRVEGALRSSQDALRQSEEQLARLAANVPGAVFQWKLRDDGRAFFTFLSEGSAELFGAPLARCLAPDFNTIPAMRQMVHPDDLGSLWQSIHDSARDLSPWKWAGRLVRSQGQIWVDCRARPTRHADGTVWDGMMLDATARMRVEDELRRTQSELEERVASRTGELARSNQALQGEVQERQRAEALLRNRARQQEAIAQLSQRALQGVEMPILLRGAASMVAATLDVEMSSIVHATPEGGCIGYGVAWDNALPETHVPVPEHSVLKDVLQDGKPRIIGDWRAQDRYHVPPALAERGLRSGVLAPIPGETGVLGVLAAHSTQAGRFSPEDVGFVEAMANVLATAIDRQRLESALAQSRARLQAVLDNTSNIIYLKDLDGRYILVNRHLEQMHRHLCPHAGPMLGSRDEDFLAPQDARTLREHDAQVLASGQAATFEEAIEAFDGRKYLLSTKFPLFDEKGAPIGVGGISIDITERKSFELAREAAREEAESARREAEHARREAEHARSEADRANEAKSEFLSRMSHELRTPLNAILGFAQLLEISRLPERPQQGVAQILKAGRHLLSLINEVLDIARIESGQLTNSIEPVMLSHVLEEVTGLIAPLASERQIALSFEPTSTCSCQVLADRQRLIQVLLNLISNAVKYNRAGGSVRVLCVLSGEGQEGQEAQQSRVRILVADDGAGIAPEKLERLWVPFDRLDAEKSGVEGTGLGLALSRALAESMNGQLHVESRQGHGSTFSLELGTASEPSAKAPAIFGEAPSVAETATTGTVLYIEDNPSNLLLAQGILEHRPHLRLITARTGREGLQLALSAPPDVVLLDLDLPDIHGLSVLQSLRREPSTRSIPVIVVSADATRSQIARLKEVGALDYLTKPLDVARLLQLLDQVLDCAPQEQQ